MHTLGIFVEGGEILVALIHSDKKKIKVDLLRSFPIEPGIDVKPLYIMKSLLAGRNPTLVSGLNAWEVFIREISFKLSKKRAILATLPFQAESFLPYPLDKSILIPFIKGSKVNLFSTSHETLENHLKSLNNLDVDPHIVSCTPQALNRFGQFLYPQLSSFLFFHFSAQKGFFGLVIDKKVVLSQTLNSIKDLDRALEFLKQKAPGPLPKEVVVTGAVIHAEALKNSFDVLVNPEMAPYAIPLGLAIDGNIQNTNSVQFRQGPFASIDLVKKRSKKFLHCAVICGTLTLLTWALGTFYIHQREKALTGGNGSLEEKILTLEKTLSKEKTQFPFLPNVPKVSDFLSYLSTHPKLPGINIKNIEYSLVKYPKLGISSEGYKVKVSMEFTAPTPRQAREFREALEKDSIVDKKEEISWKISQETYATSFFLMRTNE